MSDLLEAVVRCVELALDRVHLAGAGGLVRRGRCQRPVCRSPGAPPTRRRAAPPDRARDTRFVLEVADGQLLEVGPRLAVGGGSVPVSFEEGLEGGHAPSSHAPGAPGKRTRRGDAAAFRRANRDRGSSSRHEVGRRMSVPVKLACASLSVGARRLVEGVCTSTCRGQVARRPFFSLCRGSSSGPRVPLPPFPCPEVG
jgi:hypothetical protein